MATVRMVGFLGLYQDGDGINVDTRYALDAVNVETQGGVLRSAARPVHLRPELSGPIGTLARLYLRWPGNGGAGDVLVAASGGRLYWMRQGGERWMEMVLPDGVTAFQRDAWSWVTYEMNPEGAEEPVDVLLMSNAKDGMICVRGDTMVAERVETPRKFGVIARYAERIWGGAIDGDPDMLVYSAPFDPFNWTQNDVFPEDGAGDVMQPSWDGDSFTALTQFGAQLVAFKKRRAWRILGTDPGEYVFREQYGGGAMFAATVAVDGEGILMLGREGLMRYDGLSVAPYEQPYAKRVFARMNQAALDGACACVYQDRYYCALPLDGSPSNNAVLVHDARERTWLLREGPRVKAFLPTDDGLYYTSEAEPGRVWRWGEDAEITGALAPTRWVGPWLEFGAKTARKGGWLVTLTVAAKAPLDISVTIRTEKKARTKTLHVQPGEALRRLVFGGAGQRWRLEIESCGNQAWSIPGGVQVDAEVEFL